MRRDDPDHREDRQGAGQDQVEDRLVDAEVEAAEVDRDPRFELELVLGLEGFVFAGAAEDQQHQDRDRRSRRRARSGPWFWSSCLARLRFAEEVGDALGGEGDGEEDEDEDRGGEAGLALGRGRRAAPPSPSARRGRAWSRRRSPSPAGGCRRRVRRWRGASASTWMPRWASQAAAPTAYPSMGSPPSRKTARAAARTSRSTYLGGDIKFARLWKAGGLSDYIRKGRRSAF